jgi:pimeloyl-ACP methyl ester carboxylesterase
METVMNFAATDVLNIAYNTGGPPHGDPVFLLHGWPDAAVSWLSIASALQNEGFRTVLPSLRGSAPTEFLSPQTPRFGGAVALAQDVIDLANHLGIERFSVVGHDWGARTAYTLAALFADRLRCITALSVAFQPHAEFPFPTFSQSRLFWYQLMQCTPGGIAAVRNDPVGFARIQWDTWSPEGWFSDEDFAAVARSFQNPDWAEITFNAYRSRYLEGEVTDPRYYDLQQKLKGIDSLSVPTLMLQGVEDYCDPPSSSADRESCFLRGYQRLLLEGVGHFPHREAPIQVIAAVLDHERHHTA